MNQPNAEPRESTFVVVTTIGAPTPAMRSLAAGCRSSGARLLVIGDRKTPAFTLEGSEYFSVEAQMSLPWRTARSSPLNHYARKNIGYLLAVSQGAKLILETDDDNIPLESFWDARNPDVTAASSRGQGWVNVYRHFCDVRVWPRGFPLDAIHNAPVPRDQLPVRREFCPIQQGLADEEPDIDAVHRLILPGPVRFDRQGAVALGAGSWCPFNSQNTAWWPDAFPLLYLPACCSVRMTDIWRSFVAQVIAWQNGWSILFHSATMRQERNPHNLMKDFADEIPGYLNNSDIAREFERLDLRPGTGNIAGNMRKCYAGLTSMNLVGSGELDLLDAWLGDLASL